MFYRITTPAADYVLRASSHVEAMRKARRDLWVEVPLKRIGCVGDTVTYTTDTGFYIIIQTLAYERL